MPEPQKIYIESCQFIDMARHQAKLALTTDKDEVARRESDVWHSKQLLKAAVDKKVRIFTSFITMAECTHLQDSNAVPDDSIKRFYMGLLGSGKGGIDLVAPTLGIMERARQLRWNSGITLGGVDSIHVASAIEMGCAELITTDKKFFTNKKKIADLGLRIIRASETAHLPGEYMQFQLEDAGKRPHRKINQDL